MVYEWPIFILDSFALENFSRNTIELHGEIFKIRIFARQEFAFSKLQGTNCSGKFFFNEWL
jgi:hypothetical protein